MARAFGVSNETIRRDMIELNRIGKIAKIYGGAVARSLGSGSAADKRSILQRQRDTSIAAIACSQVAPGDTLMIDAGATIQEFARHLALGAADLTIVTNGLVVATVLSVNPSITVMVCPGTLDAQRGCVWGTETINYIAKLNAKSAFVGVDGITVHGPNDADPELTAIKRAMFAQSERRIVLANQTKFEQSGLVNICPLSRLTMLITDGWPSGDLAQILNRANVKVLTPLAQ